MLSAGETVTRMSTSARLTIEPAIADAPALTSKRRQYGTAEKRQIVEESFHPRTSVARVAREHGINANQIFKWRRLYQRGRLGGQADVAPATELLPVLIVDREPAAIPAPVPAPTPAAVPPALPGGTIELQVARGQLRLTGVVDPDALRLMLEQLLG